MKTELLPVFFLSRRFRLPRPAEEDVAVLGEEVAELLLWQAGELLPLQHKSLHAVQVLVPLLHQLFSLCRIHKF